MINDVSERTNTLQTISVYKWNLSLKNFLKIQKTIRMKLYLFYGKNIYVEANCKSELERIVKDTATGGDIALKL